MADQPDPVPTAPRWGDARSKVQPNPLAPSPGGWRLPPEHEPSWSARPWWHRHWRLFLAVPVVLPIVLVVLAGSYLLIGSALTPVGQIETQMAAASRGQVVLVGYGPPLLPGERGTFVIRLSPTTPASDAGRIACQVVAPILARDGYSQAAFEVRAADLTVLVSTSYKCP